MVSNLTFMKNQIIFALCLFIGIPSIYAQNWCGTVDHQQSLIENQPEKSAKLQQRMNSFNRLQRVNAENFITAYKAKDSLAYRKSIREVESYGDIKYDPILQVIPEYFCSTNDVEIIDKFFATMWANRVSANEMSSFSIGDCFICNTELVIERLEKITDNKQKKLIIVHIKWGLMNKFNVYEEGNSEDKKYNELIGKLKTASP